MRVIVYKIDLRLNPEDKYPVPVPAFLPYPEDDPEVIEGVKTESIDGTYTVENWDDPSGEQIVAPHNITTGEYVTIDGVLYLATQSIPNGEPVIVGQNATVTTVEAQLLELKGE